MTNPSIWTPGQAVSAESSNRVQTFIAALGQTNFTITNFTYEVGTNSLEVDVSGVNQRPGIDFIETGSNSFSLTSPIEEVGTSVFVRGLVDVHGNPQVISDASNVSYKTETVKTALDARLPEIGSYALLRAYTGLVTAFFVRGVSNNFDGGFGVFRVDASDTTSLDNGGTVLIDASGRRWKRVYSGTINVKWFGAIGDGVTNDTAAIRAACSAGVQVFFPEGDYVVSLNPSNNLDALASWTASNNIGIYGAGARIVDDTVYIANDPKQSIFQFNNCVGVRVEGIEYKGVQLGDVTQGSQIGATFVQLIGSTSQVSVKAKITDCRYGIRTGDYNDPSLGGASQLSVDINCLRVGYPLATYLTDAITGTIYAEDPHRACYIAGARGGNLLVRFKNQYVANEVCVLTDATTVYRTPGDTSILHINYGSRGCSDFVLNAIDVGSTTMTAASCCTAITLSWGNPYTTFKNIKINCDVVGSDTVSTTMSGFKLLGTIPVNLYPNFLRTNNQYCYYDNIVVSGVVDRRAQTVAGSSSNELYVLAYDTVSSTGCNVSNLIFENFKYLHGSYVTRPAIQTYTQGASGPVIFRNCYLDANVTISSSSTIRTLFENSYAYYLLRGGLLDIVRSRVDTFPTGLFVGSNCGTSESTFNTFGMRTATSALDIALTGASVTVGGLLPANAIVIGVTGVLTTAITGATGFQVGVVGALDRYADISATAQGTQFNLSNWLASESFCRVYKSATNLVVTAKTSNFTGGVLRVFVTYVASTAPTA